METLFVSSTFQDMQSERDAIRDIVLPRLNAEAQKYGQSVAVCDLRWGINTEDLDEEEANRRILDICLDEIGRSASPMIVVLGNRYGWIPPEELIRSTAGRRRLRLEKPEISVTALEIEYGMQVHRDNVFFYFREMQGKAPSEKYLPEDPGHQKKLEALKARITRESPGRSHTFQVRFEGEKPREEDIRRFADMVYQDVLRVLEPQWKKHIRSRSPRQAEQEKHWDYIREKGSSCLARMDQVRMLTEEIRSGQRSIVIKGRSGSGKSTLLSKIALVLEKEQMTVIPVACGLTEETSTAMGVLQQLVYRLETELKLPHMADRADSEAKKDPKVWRQRLNEMCALFGQHGGDRARRGSSENKSGSGGNTWGGMQSTRTLEQSRELVILVDAVDQLMKDEDRDRMIFLPSSGSGVHTVVTCLPDIVCRADREVVLPPVGEADKRAIIQRMLEEHHRELPEQVVAALLAKDASDSPLYLSLMLQRLMMMGKEDFDVINRRGGGMGEISRYQIDMIRSAPDSLEQMSAELMRAAGEKIGGEMVQRVNEYIALSRYGLRENDLALILGEQWDYLSFRQMISYLRESYMRREDGRYDFTHQSIRRGILQACEDQEKRHFKIWAAMHELDYHDPIRTSEVIYHCMMAKKYNSRKYFLSHIRTSDKDILSGSANCVHAVSMIDGGEWIGGLFDHAEQYDKPDMAMIKQLLRFFEDDCLKLFQENHTENLVKFNILQHESSLIDRLAAEHGLAALQMKCYNTCAQTAKEIGDDSRRSYTEKYFSAGKKLYREGALDSHAMWVVYYSTVTLLKDAPDRKCWERAVVIGEEALRSGLLEQLLNQNQDKGLDISMALFGSLGETYQRLGNYLKSFEVYQKDLELRMKNAERHPTEENLLFAGGGYYNVGNALMGLNRPEEACSYYEKALEAHEKYQKVGEKFFGSIFFMENTFNLYDNYSTALFFYGLKNSHCNLLEKAFLYKKKAVVIYRHYTQEGKTFPSRTSKLLWDLGKRVARIAGMDKNLRAAYLNEMCQLFDNILTEDEGRLVLDSAEMNMDILDRDYQGVFYALNEIFGTEKIQLQYIVRCRGSLLQYFDDRIKKAEKSPEPDRTTKLVIAHYNKSLALQHLGHPAFCEECLASAVAAANLFLPLEKYEANRASREFWTREREAFWNAGNCYRWAKQPEAMLLCRREAIRRQERVVELSGDPEEKSVLEKLKAQLAAETRKAEKTAPKKPSAPTPSTSAPALSTPAPMPSTPASTPSTSVPVPSPPAKDADSPKLALEPEVIRSLKGISTIKYANGSVYTGELAVLTRPGAEMPPLDSDPDRQRNALKHGYGEITYPSGASYCGEWREDRICGYGIRTDSYGKKTCGQWQDGVLVKAMSELMVKLKLKPIKSRAEKG